MLLGFQITDDVISLVIGLYETLFAVDMGARPSAVPFQMINESIFIYSKQLLFLVNRNLLLTFDCKKN